MKVKFVFGDKRQEAAYICFTAKSISEGHFPKGGFFVLPYSEKLNTKTVYFPDLNYSKSFWKAIKDCKNMDLGKPFPNLCIEEVVSKLTTVNTDKYKKIIFNWQEKEKEFFYAINDLAPDVMNTVKEIEFLITDFGTLGSFNVVDNRFLATHRSDIDPDDIGRKILYMIVKTQTQKKAEIGEHLWHERKIIVDHILKHSKLNKIIPKAINSRPRKKEEVLKRDSNAYLEKLGFKQTEGLVKKSQWGKIVVANNDIKNIFTTKEEYVFKTLFQNQGNIVEFDEFIKVPSLYALSKLIENIRRKIRDLGINKEIVATVRGKGYSMY